MELVYLNLLNNKFIGDLVITIGQFDGVHIAHTALINKVTEIAKEKKLKSGLMTFDPHPDFVLKKQTDETYITPLEEKIEFLKKFDLDYLFIVKFNSEVAQLEPKIYIKNYLTAIGVKEVVVGFDFHYGLAGKGNANTIERDSDNEIKVTIINEIKYQNEKIGSTLIRDLLASGNPREVINILGRPYQISAKVVKGMQIGSKIGIPTANLEINDAFVMVKSGVYAVKVNYSDKEFVGICNIGHNPSFNYKKDLTMEVHIIGYSGNLYGKTISVSFIEYLRPEIKFATVDDFKKQIESDIIKAKQLVQQGTL